MTLQKNDCIKLLDWSKPPNEVWTETKAAYKPTTEKTPVPSEDVLNINWKDGYGIVTNVIEDMVEYDWIIDVANYYCAISKITDVVLMDKE